MVGNWAFRFLIFENVFASIDSASYGPWQCPESGEWRSFFVSEKMELLWVLDLEGALGVQDEDLEQMVKRLRRLKFLSVWGCGDVSRLPDSLDSLKQLQTLDIRDTAICKLPKSIVKIKKLQYIRASMAETKRSLPVTSRMFCYWFFRFGPTMITGFGLRCPTALFSWLLFFSRRCLSPIGKIIFISCFFCCS